MLTHITFFRSRAWPAIRLLTLWLAVFAAAISPSAGASTYRLVHAFAGGAKDGRFPSWGSSLTASGSILYGMTSGGGATSNGVLFKVETNGTGFGIIHSFAGYSILDSGGSKNDGAYPVGTPLLAGSTIYGMTEQGGSNEFGTVFSVNTDGSGFQVLHGFGGIDDGVTPYGSLTLSGSTLYGLTEGGGAGLSEGTIFSIGIDGTGYQVLHSFTPSFNGSADGQAPDGSLVLFVGTPVSTLYGMTSLGGASSAGAIFRINTDGSGYEVIYNFTGTTSDGAEPRGSLTKSGATLYGMTSSGGANNVGTIFQFNLFGSVFHILHSFSFSEAFDPFGDLVLSGPTLYGMTYSGGTPIGNGSVFQINTNGGGYQQLHAFRFPGPATDGGVPFGSPILLGSELYGMTSLGGSITHDDGCIFAVSVSASGSTGSGAPTITTASPLPEGTLDVAYHQQLAATGGTSPYTWAVSTGRLPAGLTLSPSGLLGGKPTAGAVASFSIKVTDHAKLSSTNAFSLTISAPDKIPPTLTITTPKAGIKVTTVVFVAEGTAKDNVAVASVYCQLNKGAWTKALTVDAFAHWSCDLSLAPGANVLSVYAVDTSTNYSKTNTIKFTYSATAVPFGMASVSPALPSVVGTSAKPLQAAAGSYHGLFAPADAARQNNNSGAISLALTGSGSLSGTLFLGPDTLKFSGSFDASGAARVLTKRPGKDDLITALRLDPARQAITGEVTDGTFVSQIAAYRNVFSSNYPATNYEGKYAVTITGINNSSNGPLGTGQGTVKVDALGNVTFLGTLANGAGISQASGTSRDGYWPLYLQPYGGEVSFWAWNQFTNGTVHSLAIPGIWGDATKRANVTAIGAGGQR